MTPEERRAIETVIREMTKEVERLKALLKS